MAALPLARRLAPLVFLAGCAAPARDAAPAEVTAPAAQPAPSTPSTGARAPRLVSMDGAALDLAAELDAGRTVVLVFWQTWCASCLREAPALAEAARAHERELRFVGVVPGPDRAVDEAEVRELVERFELPYPQVRDRDDALIHAYAVEGTPTLIALGPDGAPAWRGVRPPEDWLALHRALRGE